MGLKHEYLSNVIANGCGVRANDSPVILRALEIFHAQTLLR